jgi:hypothetical protein
LEVSEAAEMDSVEEDRDLVVSELESASSVFVFELEYRVMSSSRLLSTSRSAMLRSWA